MRFAKSILYSCLILSQTCVGCIAVPAQHVYKIDNRVAQINPTIILAPDRPAENFQQAVFSPDGKTLLTTYPPTIWSSDGQRRFRSFGSQEIRYEIESIAWSHDGRRVITQIPTSVSIWDATTGTNIKKFSVDVEERSGRCAIASSPDDCLVAWVEHEFNSTNIGVTNTLAVLSTESGECIKIPVDTNEVPVFFSPDSQNIYCDNMCWHVEKEPKLKLEKRRELIMPIQAISGDGRYGYGVQPLYADWQMLQIPETLGNICKDGAFFVMDRHNREMALYQIDLTSGDIVARREFTFAGEYWQGKGGPNISMDVKSMAVSSDGKRLAIATNQGIHIIDLQLNKDLGQFIYHLGEGGRLQTSAAQIDFVSLSPDGKQVAAVEDSGAVYIWNLP
jgi:WD40 repeat protein